MSLNTIPGNERPRTSGYVAEHDTRKRTTEDVRLHFGGLIGTIQRHEYRNDDLRCVFKEFPILGPESTLAARAALASRAQGHYEAIHGELLGTDGPFDLDHILAGALGVRGTPAFVIGDGMIQGALPLEQFRAAIADVRVAPDGARNRSGAD